MACEGVEARKGFKVNGIPEGVVIFFPFSSELPERYKGENIPIMLLAQMRRINMPSSALTLSVQE